MLFSNAKGNKFKSLKSVLFYAPVDASVEHPNP